MEGVDMARDGIVDLNDTPIVVKAVHSMLPHNCVANFDKTLQSYSMTGK